MNFAVVLCVLNFAVVSNSNQVLRRELDKDQGKYCFNSLGEATNEIIEITNKMNKKCHEVKSYPVAFTAISTDGNALPDGPIIFGNVLANVGNAYDKATGKFTAPVNGLYTVSVSIMGLHHISIHVRIIKNGIELVRLWTNGDGRGVVASHTINIPLMRGDQMWASGTAGHKLYALEPYNVFSAALIARGTF